MKISTALTALTLSTTAFAHTSKDALTSDNLWNGGRPDGHAPISVMADHTHNTGEWMLSYRYMQMHMEDLYVGDSKIQPSQAGYMLVPSEMDMEMHMFGIMYAPTDNLTLMAMTNYIKNTMDMEFTMGMNQGKKTHMESDGWGDTSVGGLYKFYDAERKRAHFGLSFSLPTGSTGETFKTPMGMTRHQPFPMQLGTGTFDLLPSLTYLSQPSDLWSWGAQLNGRIHLGENNQGYSFGDSIGATSWLARNITEWASLSLRVGAKSWKGIQGDTDLSVNTPMMPNMSSPADPQNHGGTRLDAGVGLNLWHPSSGFRVAAELAAPVYQKLNGPQLGQDWTLTLGTQFAW
ncbi:transporter [Rubritalea tangerina]|uniref:Transporter n=1 Tax=Rubritalea tangerina TaxID=430798 RepID=A0ABW4ZCC7_9BACT